MSIGRRQSARSGLQGTAAHGGRPAQARKKAAKKRTKQPERTPKEKPVKKSRSSRKPAQDTRTRSKPADIDGGVVIEALTEAASPIDERELGDLLGAATSGARRKLGRVLVSMVDEGTVIVNRRGLYALPERMDILAGRIIGHADGFGFVSSGDRATDLFLPPRQMRKVMHGDRVLARVTSIDSRGRREGAVVEVVEKRRQVVGRYVREKGFGYVQPDDKRINHEISISDKDRGDAKNGAMVVVEITHHPADDRHAGGRVIEVLGDRMEPGMEIEIAIRKHELPHKWPEGLEEKAQKKARPPSNKELSKRVDLRDLPLVTIDGEDARDFDDAVFAERDGRGWRLVVAIADVGHYVTPGSALDVEAYERGNSVYFPRRVIPMLPESLSNGMCSLNPDEDRLCMFCDMQISASGQLRDFSFGEGVMRSRRRLTYTEVAAYLSGETDKVDPATMELSSHLDDLNRVYQALVKARVKRGALDLDLPEPFFDLDENGRIRSIRARSRNDAHRLIEECMLATNVAAALYMSEEAGTGVYRIHEQPDSEAIGDLRNFLAEFGVVLGGGYEPGPRDIQAAIAKIQSRGDVAPVLQTSILRAMKQAVYSTDNAGHFALGYEAYGHFTSPIRRYPDLMVHRIIRAKLRGEDVTAVDNSTACEHSSMTERRADDATRDVDGFLKAEFMSDRLGEDFDAVVTGVTGFGVFVQLDDFFIDGLVHISDLGGDYFHFEPARWRLVGEKSGQVFRLGTRLKVKVASADLEEGRVDFVPAKSSRKSGGAKSGRKTSGKGSGKSGRGSSSKGRSGSKTGGDTKSKSKYKAKGKAKTGSSSRKKKTADVKKTTRNARKKKTAKRRK